jgi:hypothetical protein
MRRRVSMLALFAALGCAREEKAITKAPETRRDAPSASASASSEGPVVWLMLDRRRMEAHAVDYADVEASLGREPKVAFSLERHDADGYELRLGHVKLDAALLKRPVDGKTNIQIHFEDIAKLEVRSK